MQEINAECKCDHCTERKAERKAHKLMGIQEAWQGYLDQAGDDKKNLDDADHRLLFFGGAIIMITNMLQCSEAPEEVSKNWMKYVTGEAHHFLNQLEIKAFLKSIGLGDVGVRVAVINDPNPANHTPESNHKVN